MANYSSIKATINANIKTNGNEEITGAILNSVMIQVVNSLGAGYQFAGIASPTTDPGTPDERVFYIAATAGTYTHFGGITITDGEVAILKWDTAWHKDVTGIASADNVSQLRQEVTAEISRLSLIEFASCQEDGIFFVDASLNIGVSITQNGLSSINTFKYREV